MSILIKGIDKPTDCGLCPFEDFGYCTAKGERNTSESGVDADCPLIEVADRKTENSSEKPNNCKDEPQYEMGMGTLKCDNCSEYGSFKCTKCDGEMYFKRLEPKDEPTISKMEQVDEPQTDCAWR